MALGQHLWRLALLMSLSAGVQAWVVLHAVVPAQDAVRYLAQAQCMDRNGWGSVLVDASDPPLFPTLVLIAKRTLSLSPFEPLISPRHVWLTSLQLVAACGVIASIVPLYLLLLRWIDARVALFGCVLFSFLGSVARLGADGLSDSTQLLAVLCGLACLTWFLGGRSFEFTEPSRQQSARGTALLLCGTGMALGMGMLCGSTAIALLPAVLVALLSENRTAAGASWSLRRRGLSPGWVGVGVSAVLLPYLMLTAGTNSAKVLSRIRADHEPERAAYLNFASAPSVVAANHDPEPTFRQAALRSVETSSSLWRLADGQPMAFGHKDTSTSSRNKGLFSALGQFVRELFLLMGLPVTGLALIGLLREGTSRAGRTDRFFARVVVWYCLFVLAHASRAGYLSDRHLLPLVPVALCWAARGAVALGRGIEASLPWSVEWSDAWPRVPARAWFARLVVACAASISSVGLLQPMHAARWGHRQAAEWLAAHATEPGSVLDTRGWTALFSGRPTYRHEAAQAALSDSRLAFVVVETSELERNSPRSKTLRELLGRWGKNVMRFSAPGDAVGEGVAIYRWDPQRFAALTPQGGARE